MVVVPGSFVHVAESLIGLVDQLEGLLGVLVLVLVGMVLQRHFVKSLATFIQRSKVTFFISAALASFSTPNSS